MRINKKIQGVTLIEVLLVLVIASFVLVMMIGFMQQKTDELRRSRASLQMQQILNAGLSYYIVNSSWPTDLTTLQGTFLPPTAFSSPFANPYLIYGSQNGASMFYVFTNALTVANAQLIAGKLPLAFVTDAAGAGTGAAIPTQSSNCSTTVPAPTCTYVVASVNVPGQNLNNANSVTFSNLYHNGGCVPVPACPVDAKGNTMTPQIIVVPVSVSGINDAPSCDPSDPYNPAKCSGVNLYPLTNFTAYATGGTDNKPPSCGTSAAPTSCLASMSGTGTLPSGYNYWRVCMEIQTVKGRVTPNAADWGNLSGSIMAITRCQPNNEGNNTSTFNVWAPN